MKMADLLEKQSTTVIIDLKDYVSLTWADDINCSGLFGKAVRRRMRDDGISPTQFQDGLVNALDAGVIQDALLETSNQHEVDQ